ncbi:hypothetical protein VFPFJ_08325 [Purpureocillium lilacinum]|uniref:Uncharacterized protein n=1 Tax=Purpureocillium lilacinum TaxID=33203 RepID=A0A179H6W7_PURLI|nr:hypothetical protein VFPFJ_08325 [Purpureocillium lilacinum]KAK4093789.1 hypothetical protein Purlil1_2123 [Purpureocillium lilacinum]OAQ85936.1 hypothetical protein VFPFJ_08325 [Purpureocillium lilacinum]PWI66924.1 hypothetical protein PCL_04430 [Purpureocillium lilacinum]
MGARRLNFVALVAVMVMASVAVANTAAGAGAAVLFLAEEGQARSISRPPGLRTVELAASDHPLLLGMSFDCILSDASSAKCAPVTRGGGPDLVHFLERAFVFASFYGEEEKHEARLAPATMKAGPEQPVARTAATATTSLSHGRRRTAALVLETAGRRLAPGTIVGFSADRLVLDDDTRLERPAPTPTAQAAGPSSSMFAAEHGAKRRKIPTEDDDDNDADADHGRTTSLVLSAPLADWPGGGAKQSPHGSAMALLLGRVFGLAAAPSVGVVL